MKTKILTLTVAIFLSTITTKATVINITVSNFAFTPNSVNASIGDTILWTWVIGTHTTTSTTTPQFMCDPPWDAPIDSIANTFFYVVNCPGTYEYKCTPHGFTGSINVVPTVVDNINKKYRLFIYSNPTNGMINLPASHAISAIYIYNVLGEKIYHSTNQPFINSTIDLSAHGNGIYFITIKSESEFLTQKIIKQ